MTKDSYIALRASHDSSHMHDAIASFPSQARKGIELASAADLSSVERRPFDSVVICGMGGSAFGGDVLRTYAFPVSRHPITVVRSYGLPAFVDERTLVIAMSYSGNTEETLAAFEDARRRNAPIIAITTGGALREQAQAAGAACVLVPGGYAPRAAFGYLFFTLLTVCARLGIVPDQADALEETLRMADQVTAEWSMDSGRRHAAMDIAERIAGAIPVIYAGAERLECVPTRWRCQIEENAKTLAYANTLPEMNHNEIVGWEDDAPSRPRIAVIALHDRDDTERIRRRFDITLGLIRPRAADIIELDAVEVTHLARLVRLILLGDWVSYYLALVRGTDPTPIASINALKQGLAATA